MLSYDAPAKAAQRSTSSATPADLSPSSTVPEGVATMGSTEAATTASHGPERPHIWLVTGPAGCGKSTVAKHLADTLGLTYIEGDEYHPPANIEKMSNGIPLTDADRWDWLTALREAAVESLSSGGRGVVVTCSALKRKYRDVIRVAPYYQPHVHVHFIYLSAPEEVLQERVAARQNHYMGADMVRSQFKDLEPPQPDECDVISIDVSQSMERVTTEALAKVSLALDQESAS